MSTDLILICHGHTVQTQGDQVFGWWADQPLSLLGRQQALLIGECLKNNFDIQAIYASPLKRTQETADIVSDVVKVVPAAEHALRELDSGLLSKLSYEEAQAQYPEAVNEGQRIPGGESYDDMHRRVAWVINRLVKQSPDRQIACITHGGPIVAYLRAFMGYDPQDANKPRFLCRMASLHHIQLSPDGDRTIVSLNDIAHLSGMPSAS
ncbi:MAG: histidine phosphatase family protein [bacterium]|jgi:ribonuclease H / adenosylcobalamin/alpha-ribazole phosphatase|nr:histidine phosphatase family protein [bacterium]